jgi:hydrogenase maturation protease
VSPSRKDIVVLGLGNPLMTDEGIGIEVLSRLSKMTEQFPSVEFIDAGTAGFSVLHMLSGRRRAMMIDCCQMGTPVGTIRVFTPDDVASVKSLSQFSLHEADILQVLDLARRTGECPEHILIFGVEPQVVAPGIGLSKKLAAQLDSYVEHISATLKGWL